LERILRRRNNAFPGTPEVSGVLALVTPLMSVLYTLNSGPLRVPSGAPGPRCCGILKMREHARAHKHVQGLKIKPFPKFIRILQVVVD